MFFRWLHKSWKYFWGIVFSLLLTILIVVGAVIGLLQLDATQDYITDRIEQQVESTYKAELSIGDLDGFLPFQLNLHNVTLARTDSSVATDTLFTVQRINSKIDVWGLLQNQVTITGFSVNQPKLWIRSDEQGKIRLLERRQRTTQQSQESGEEPWLSTVEIVAPSVQVTDGNVYLRSMTTKNQIGNLPPSFALSNIQAELFVDWSERQRYLDIESFSAETDNLKMGKIQFSGQLYSDKRYLELNSFYLALGNSQFVINGEIDGVNLLESNFTAQLMAAKYNLNVTSDEFYLQDLSDLLGDLPDLQAPLTMDIRTEGTTDSLWVDRASFGMDESIINFNGLLKNLHPQQAFAYEVRLDRVNLQKSALEQLFGNLSQTQLRAFENLTASGKANGSLDSVNVDLTFSSPMGKLTMQGESQLVKPYHYLGSMEGTNLDVSSLVETAVDTTSLNFTAELNGSGITFDEAVSNFKATFTDSRVDNIKFESLKLTSSLKKGYWSQEYDYKNGKATISGSSWIDFSRKVPPISMQGHAQNINLANIFAGTGVASSQLNFDYNVEMQGLTPNRIHGRANLDVKPSVIGGDSVRAHQLYMDLNSPDEQLRTFRLTSSLFDMNLTGQIAPRHIIDQAKFWAAYLSNRFKSEILMNAPIDSQATAITPPSRNVVIDGTIKAKDLGLMQQYLPDLPTIKTDSRINFNVNTDGTRLLVSAEMQADTLFYDQLNFTNSRTQFTASFRSDRTFSEFSSVDLQVNVGSLKTGKVDLDSVNMDLSMKKDSLHLSQNVGAISDNASFRMALDSQVSDSAIAVKVQNFFLGNTEYAWTNQGTPSFTYMRSGKVDFNSFSFQNKDEFFRLQGTLSKNRSDSLTYILRNISLSRISDLIKGQVEFGGVLNGTLVTRSLTRQPTIQGKLNVSRFALNDRMIGDVHFNSRYNPNKDRFDTQINIVTDSTKYEQYLKSNDGVGQNITLDGYFVTPNPDVKQDTVYYFDANFKQIDMWVVPLIVNNVFAEMEGQATGDGYITGNLNSFDFHADFQTKNVFAKPNFLNTNYFVSGHVAVDRQDGVILDSLNVMDTKGGTGVLTGAIDLNDFKPITYLDLTLDMNRLQFLNNKMDPDVPFYGNVSGSGVVRLTGSNRDLYMRTVNPVQITSNSQVSIPLMEETELQKTGKFIRFVDSFENIDQKTSAYGNEQLSADESSDAEQLQQAIESMTFSERFDLDLQFVAPNNVTVNLIFDPVTGEVLTAQGTGQLRITMQDQDVQMFGQYNINDGSYQFVTGEIISRRLELEPGGTIIWEGQPDNARLDISAVYHARPDIQPLTAETGAGGGAQSSQNGGQRVPIDLIVEINGTLSSVENNYYFRLPNSLDLSSNSTLQYTINQINRDEQQKLLQATSILFTGQFIATQGLGSGTGSSSLNLTRSTVLNPLLSNQVISPLLSNQINALLNSDVSRLDIDLSLNAYDEVDLGIALRLYNDRLVLRREGQIAGGDSQSSLGERIGDLNATYRIRRGLSLTAFHRQDQVLSSLRTTGSQAGDVTPTVDGIGLEAQLQFNTWNQLLNRISNTFNRIFGGKKHDDEKKNDKLADQEAKKEEQK